MTDNPGRRRLAVSIDVANAEGTDFRALLARARELGRIDEVRAYGDFWQQHFEDTAIELYSLGVRLIHCPSWAVAGRGQDGSVRWKRTDDRLMEKEIRHSLGRRASASIYMIVSADADIIPTLHALREHNKEVLLLYPAGEGSLGHVLYRCDVFNEEAPLKAAAPDRGGDGVRPEPPVGVAQPRRAQREDPG